MFRLHLIYCILLLFTWTYAQDVSVKISESKPVYLTNVSYDLFLENATSIDSISRVRISDGNTTWFDENAQELMNKDGQIHITCEFPSSGKHYLEITGSKTPIAIRVVPGWLSVLPPLAAIILALITRQVLIALLAGVWFGASILFGYNPFLGFLYALSDYIGKAPADPDRISILIFSLALGGMVGVISKSGGTQGIVEKLSRFASNARKGQLVTWLMGVLIFFDDYANTLIVGNTMRPLTDKLKISREKLSYLVDSTAAPVANIAIISTWIGYELSLINDSFQTIGLQQNAYVTFFKTIPLNFYPLFALVFGFAVAVFGRDFFSMYKAEYRTANDRGLLREGAMPLADMGEGELATKEGAPLRWFNALIPVGLVVLTTLAGLWFTGLQATPADVNIKSLGLVHFVSTVIGISDSFAVLMWASFIGGISAIILAMAQKILTMNEALMAWVGGVKAMVMAALILTLAWSIGNICTDLQTADYVISVTKNLLAPHWIPTLTFIISGIIAFSTGTSWGTMAILTPIVIPLAHQLPMADPTISSSHYLGILLSSIAAILAGSTFGDHCSPISDTTIMSSMASGADHVDHVRTQLPYALIVAGISILLGYIPVGYGVPGWIMLLIGFVVILGFVRILGKKVERDL
jgi:Na+/H+ antiporter NhaC